MNIEQIAKIAHEVNRAYCAALGDNSLLPWDQSSPHQRQMLRNGVLFRITYPKATAEDSHINWLKAKTNDGWTHGPVKDEVAKTHPCFIGYDELPIEMRAKDSIFGAVVKQLVEYTVFGSGEVIGDPDAAA